MSEADFPLFPLNMVLFPGVPILLHIFEDRYHKMINRCVDEQQPFGIILVEAAQALGSKKAAHKIGCSAEIVTIQHLENGRMNVAAIGKERFRIHSTNNEQPYLQGEIELIPLADDLIDNRVQQAAEILYPYIDQYIEQLREVVDIQVNWDGLPDDPVELAYLAAYILQIVPEQKQAILEQKTALELLRSVLKEYSLEIHTLKSMVEMRHLHPDLAKSKFSLN